MVLTEPKPELARVGGGLAASILKMAGRMKGRVMNIRLNNGAEILDWKIRKGGLAERAVVGVVLARLEDNDLHPFVVWYIASDDEVNFDASTGDYLTNEEDARSAFRERRL